jgi:hypothetical protein
MVRSQSKLQNIVEWNCYLPPGILNAGAQYENGVWLAEKMGYRLGAAVLAYAGCLNMTVVEKGRKILSGAGEGLKRQALMHYWTALDGQAGELVKLVSAIKPLDPWERIVQDAAQNAFRVVCPRNDARRLLAFTLGARELQ